MATNLWVLKQRMDVTAVPKQLGDKIAALEHANEELATRNASLLLANTALNIDMQALNAAKEALEIKHASLEKSHQLLEAKSHRTSTAIKQLSSNLAGRTFKSATRNIAGMPGEAIPYIGTGIMVVVTALDVKDACDTLKDINTLNTEAEVPNEDETRVCGMLVPTTSQILSKVKDNWKDAYATAVMTVNEGKERLPYAPPKVPFSKIRELIVSIFEK